MHVSLKKDRQCVIITKLYMCSHFVHMVLFSSCNLVQCRTVSKYNNTFGYAQALYFATVVTHTISSCSLIHYDNGVSICRRNMLPRTCRYHHQQKQYVGLPLCGRNNHFTVFFTSHTVSPTFTVPGLTTLYQTPKNGLIVPLYLVSGL